MSRRALHMRPAWQDRFALPTRERLLSAFGSQQRRLLDMVRERLLALESVEESLSWRGIPWRWTFGYSMEGEIDRPWAYLVPQPRRPLFVMPMTGLALEALDTSRLSRILRDGIASATQVGGVYWPTWELTGKPLTEELLSLAQRRHQTLLALA